MSDADLFLPQDLLDSMKEDTGTVDELSLDISNFFHTGSYALDRIISVKDGDVGIPAPCIVELAGPPSTAKTTLALEMIAGVLELNGFALMIDAEKRLNENYTEILLGDLAEKMIVSKTRFIQKAFWEMEKNCRKLIKHNLKDLPAIYVLDSMGALDDETRYKFDKEGEKFNPEAKYHAVDFGPGKAVKRCLGFAWEQLSQTNCFMLVINHEHDVIDIHNPMAAKFKKTKTTGGVFKDYMAGVRLSVRVIKTLKTKGRKSGAIVKVRNTKSSVDMPFGECELEIKFGKGICREKDIYDTARKLDLIYKENGRFHFEGEEIGARDKGIEAIKSDHGLYDDLVEGICDAPPTWADDEEE